MFKLLKKYFQLMLHPFTYHERVGSGQPSNKILSLVSANTEQTTQTESTESNFLELVGISWIFVTVHVYYSFGSTYMGTMFVDEIQKHFPEMQVAFLSGLQTQKVFMITSLLQLILFPLEAWLFVKIWSSLTSMFVSLFRGEDRKQECQEICRVALVSNGFLLVPIFGIYMKKVATFVYLYAGLRKRLELSKVQAIAVLISPLFVLFLLISLIIFYCFLMMMS